MSKQVTIYNLEEMIAISFGSIEDFREWLQMDRDSDWVKITYQVMDLFERDINEFGSYQTKINKDIYIVVDYKNSGEYN